MRSDASAQRARKLTAALVPLALAALELVHPSAAGASISEDVAAAGWLWSVIHALLFVGYFALAVVLWHAAGATRYSRIVVAAFAACNSVYLAIDGLGVGVLSRSDPTTADALWSSTPVLVLAQVTGALWSLALLLLAVGRNPRLKWGAAITWLCFVAGAFVPGATLASRVAGLATGGWAVYERGAAAIPLALLVFAAVLRQHVGPEAALGLVFVAGALLV